MPSLIDEATWDVIQERVKENGKHSGRPARHFVALRGMLWCGECGQKIHPHARDWEYVYHNLADGTRTRYRIQKNHLKVKYCCGGQQHYGFKCRAPEYVLDTVLFPRVWNRLCEALQHRSLLLAGMESRLTALQDSDEVGDLKRIEARLQKATQREISYAEQRAEGVISKEVHAELMMRLREERKELEQEHQKVSDRVGLLRDAREQLDAARILVQALPQILGEVAREEQEQLIMALIDRIDVDKDNQLSINLRLDPDVIRGLPNPLLEFSRRPGLPLKDDFRRVLSGSSNCRHTRSTDCKPG